MSTTKRYRAAARGISIPKDEAALARIEAGTADQSDWLDVPAGAVCDPPKELLRGLLRSKLVRVDRAKEVTSDD